MRAETANSSGDLPRMAGASRERALPEQALKDPLVTKENSLPPRERQTIPNGDDSYNSQENNV